jgi:trigger factor
MPLQITIKKLKTKIECRAVYGTEDVTKARSQALATLAQSINIPGFRPGKAPANLVQEKIDTGRLLEETVRVLLPEAIRMAVNEHKLSPIIPPKAAIEKEDPLTVVLTFVERPGVTVKGNKVVVEKKEVKVEEKDVEQMLQSLLQEHQTSKTVDRAAVKGDRLVLDVRGEDGEDKPIAGSEMKDRPVVIGSKMLIPGFEDALIGLKTGDSKSFPLKFPEKYHAEHLQGKPVTFHVTVKSVEEVTLPELTDAFAKEKFHAESAAALKDRIRSAMKEQEDRIERQRREGAFFEALLKATSVDLAEELIEDEFQALVEDFASSLKEQGTNLEQWMQKSKKTAKDLDADMRKRATDRLTLRMGMQQLIQDKEITVSDEDMQKAIKEMMEPLEAGKRLELAPLYAKGERNYEQLKWQKMVEKVMEEMLK